MQPNSWSSTILRTLGVSRVTVIEAGPKLRAAGAACLLTAALAMSGIPTAAQAQPVQQAYAADDVSFIGSQASTASIGRIGIPEITGMSSSANGRELAFDAMISGAQALPVREKLEKVNRFFNEQIRYQTDSQAWGAGDYWATPKETLTKGAGDCEDFAIAKYYALRQLEIDQSKLKIVYVKSSKFSEPHMVLAYSEKPGGDPLVLDNIEKSISTLSKRNDLSPVYSFNDSGLYLPGSDALVAGPERLSKWQTLMAKVADEQPRQAVALNNGKPVDVSMFSTGDLNTSSSIDSYLKASPRPKPDHRLDSDGPDLR